MPETPTKTDLAIPDRIRFDSIQRIVQSDENITPAQRRKLIKQQFRLIFELRQEQFKAAVEMEKEKLAALKELTRREMIKQSEIITLQIREEFITTIGDFGHRVEMTQLEFLTDFADDLNKFRERLNEIDLDPAEKERILTISKKAFDRVADRLADLTENILELLWHSGSQKPALDRPSTEELISYVRERVKVPFAERLAKRLNDLVETSQDEYPDQAPISPQSLQDFIESLQSVSNLVYPNVVLTPNGSIRAEWRKARNQYFAAEFMGDGGVRFVVFAPDPKHPEKTTRVSGLTSADSLMELVHCYRVLDWASQPAGST